MNRYCLLSATAAMALTSAIAAATDPPGTYAASLGRVYGGYQRILAMKEACDTATPATRAVNSKAFAGWETQHRALIQDLERRVSAMIETGVKNKDKDQYVRALALYRGEILLERKEYRDVLLGLGADELREQCQRMPETLRGPGADFAKVYASELEIIRKRK